MRVSRSQLTVRVRLEIRQPDLLFAFDGPPVPVAPDVIARDAEGRVTLRAVRLSSPIRLDGQLDEAVHAATPAFSDFFQMKPVEGAIATEKTEGWIFD